MSTEPFSFHSREIRPSEVSQLLKCHGFSDEIMESQFQEWKTLEKLSQDLSPLGRIWHFGFSTSQDRQFPLLGFEFGNPSPEAPTLLICGGVHGLERIGAQVALSLMATFSEHLLWDSLLQQALQKIRVAFYPIANPWGIFKKTRSNPNGVDLMRNAPIEADESATWLVAGHRISNRLPWYRGDKERLEPEAKALVEFTIKNTAESKRAIALDFHSGFGSVDQLWFPFAKSSKPFPHLAEMHALKTLFEQAHPHHFYKIEPQAKNYTTNGDLWDYLYELQSAQNKPQKIFLPLAVEMGSWLWVRKNPLQIFSALGPFNPLVPHRQKRILRRHQTLFDFLIRTLYAEKSWPPINHEQREKHQEQALELWYSSEKELT